MTTSAFGEGLDSELRVDAFLAESVVVAEGKLYAHGAGWNVLQARAFPVRHPRVGVGVLIRVPYTATNVAHRLDVKLIDEDGHVLPLGEEGRESLTAEFTLGRPPQLPAGDEQIVPIAINLDNLQFAQAGRFAFVLELDGREASRLSIRVVAGRQA